MNYSKWFLPTFICRVRSERTFCLDGRCRQSDHDRNLAKAELNFCWNSLCPVENKFVSCRLTSASSVICENYSLVSGEFPQGESFVGGERFTLKLSGSTESETEELNEITNFARGYMSFRYFNLKQWTWLHEFFHQIVRRAERRNGKLGIIDRATKDFNACKIGNKRNSISSYVSLILTRVAREKDFHFDCESKRFC